MKNSKSYAWNGHERNFYLLPPLMALDLSLILNKKWLVLCLIHPSLSSNSKYVLICWKRWVFFIHAPWDVVIPRNGTSLSEWWHKMCHRKKGQNGWNILNIIGDMDPKYTMFTPVSTYFDYDFGLNIQLSSFQPLYHKRVAHIQPT